MDTVHGGDLLAERLVELGCEAVAINPYRGEKEDVMDYDVLVSPVHMYPSCGMLRKAKEKNIPVINHHQITKKILMELGYLDDVDLCVEVTGTVGKTSCSLLLLQIFREEGFETVAHTSNGVYHNNLDNRIDKQSVAPYGTILALEKTIELDITPDIWISEFSIGFTGIGDIASLTSVDQDYLIADKTKKASNAKLDSVDNLKNNCIFNSAIKNDRANNDFNCLKTEFDGENLKIDYKTTTTKQVNKGTVNCKLPLYPYFKDSIRTTVLTAASNGCTPKSINKILNQFNGIPGRMQTKKIKGRTIIDNSCAGTRISSLNQYLKNQQQKNKSLNNTIILVGEDEKNICEEMQYKQVKKTVNKYNYKQLITVGKKYQNLGTNVDDIDKAINLALKKSKPNDTILNFVKTWR
ncbi:hypothetical protein [Methanonatronarchaeum thermophilum]|uniref:hypothetical protein n=1 Tax=Methanonatronarchaeum thermophilum TaxID=1927129 RepID=UPI00117B5EA3|nr:hypothetical protein [Methanonatronarchaeum thermophilum]